MIYLGLTLFLFCLIFFWHLLLVDSGGAWVITPLLLFAMFEIVLLWPATVYAYYSGLSRDAYPVLVAGLGFACFLGGFVLFRWLPLGRARLPRAFLALPIQPSIHRRSYVLGIGLTMIVLETLIDRPGVPG